MASRRDRTGVSALSGRLVQGSDMGADIVQPAIGNDTQQIASGDAIRVGFLVGPTGVGKSAVALQLADALKAEIVNADSRQVYRGMDIGTAKSDGRDRARVPHHLVDLRTPAEPLDVAQFTTLARAAIAGIAARGRNPLVVGGSGLYLRVLRGGIFPGPPASPTIRRELESLAAERGVGYLRARLVEVDPEAAARISYRDLYRTVRALEVFQLTGRPISDHQREHRFAARAYATLTIGLGMERKRLCEAINRRFDAMIAEGLVEEVRALLAAGYDPGAPPLSTIGYRQIVSALRGEVALIEAIEMAKRETRRLAKRQLTWFRADPEIVWLDAERGVEQARALLGDFFARADEAANG